MIEKICETCGDPFKAERQRNKFCGKPCQYKAARTGNGYVQTRAGLEHRVIIENHLGRPLVSDEHVHHQNGDKRDNRVNNLRVLTAAEHTSLHRSKHPKVKECKNCGAKYEPNPQQRGRQKTCSKNCRYELAAKTRRSRNS